MGHRFERILLLAVLLLVPGCAGETYPYGWEIQFSSSEDELSSEWVLVRILEGGCASTTSHFEHIIGLRTATTPRDIDPMEPGVYGFEAQALTGTCVPVASQCEELDLPGTHMGNVRLTLQTTLDRPGCTNNQACIGGRCEYRSECDPGCSAGRVCCEDEGCCQGICGTDCIFEF